MNISDLNFSETYNQILGIREYNLVMGNVNI
jgi:hypothetical protein